MTKGTQVNKQIYSVKRHAFKVVFTVLLIFILSAILIVPFYKKVYPNIYLSKVYVGDKTKSEALEYFKSNYKIPAKLTLSINDKNNDVLTSEIVKEINYDKSIDRAFNYTHSGNILNDAYAALKLVFNPTTLTPIITFDEDKLLETVLIISDSVDSKPIEPSVKKVNGDVQVFEGKDGVEIDLPKARFDIGNAISNSDNNNVTITLKKVAVKLNPEEVNKFKLSAQKLLKKEIDLSFEGETTVLNDDTILSFLDPSGISEQKIKSEILTLSKKLNRNPQDSVFIVDNGVVTEFTPSQDGIIVNEDELVKRIKDSVGELSSSDKRGVEIEIPTIKTSPKINTGDVNNLGVKTLLGRGRSNFRGSIPNRIYNVNLAQSKFRGLLIEPGQVVSFNEVLGDVSAFTGYKAAYVIKDGKTVLGDGGGVCQVSTTLFRAVLNAGLPVIERRAHAYRVGYYEQGYAPGLDATVYSPTTDFKFKNDTPAYLLIQPTINLQDLTLEFEIYGTSDGRVSNVSKPIITSSVAPAADLYVDDPTLPAGQIKQIEHKAYGAKVIFDYTVTRDGQEIINKKFVSNYQPWQAVYLRGTLVN